MRSIRGEFREEWSFYFREIKQRSGRIEDLPVGELNPSSSGRLGIAHCLQPRCLINEFTQTMEKFTV